MKLHIDGCIICDRATAVKVWHSEPENRHLLYLDTEWIASANLSNEDLNRLEERKRTQKGYVYKRGDKL